MVQQEAAKRWIVAVLSAIVALTLIITLRYPWSFATSRSLAVAFVPVFAASVLTLRLSETHIVQIVAANVIVYSALLAAWFWLRPETCAFQAYVFYQKGRGVLECWGAKPTLEVLAPASATLVGAAIAPWNRETVPPTIFVAVYALLFAFAAFG